ncbi:protein NDR1-like [Euphorbia lathyris]|uniref:protein NDR1-like n=1 Tax=Euphorbia lathyris TaxID=212925 RepID=UPI0033142121
MCKAGSFYLWILQLIVLLAILALGLWLTLTPKNPTFTIVELTLPSSKNSSAGTDNQDGTISYTLEISNPSKDSTVYYDEILLVFYFGQDLIGNNKIPAFEQGKGDKIQKSNHVDANDKKVGRAISDGISKGKADLKVDLATKIKYKTWGVKSKHHEVKLEAEIPVGSDGKILGKKKHIQLRNPSKKWKLRANKFL